MEKPVDIIIGNRLRMGRKLKNLSQIKLGGMVGVSFQQIQKYEKGTNRISVSRLCEFSKALDLPVAFFLPAEFKNVEIQHGHSIQTVVDLRNQIKHLRDRLEKIRQIASQVSP